VAERFEIGPDDRYPIVFPFTHIGGIGMLVVQLMTGAGAILVEQYEDERTPPFLAAQDVTIRRGRDAARDALFAVPAPASRAADLLAPARGDGRRRAEAAAPALEVKAELGGAGVVSVYGLTEAPFVVLSSLRDSDDALARSEGRAAGGAELRIVDAAGRVCAPDVEGEIRVRGPQICRGYLDSKLDADAFDADGFFRTGDLGSLDARGFLLRDGASQGDHHPQRREHLGEGDRGPALRAPAIADAAVIGLPDARTGERCCAVVVPAPGAALDLAEVVRHCAAAGLARQKLPEQLEIVASCRATRAARC
jgi:non-ribosomal peptide synthetase component E (peptide arylation enzyme)